MNTRKKIIRLIFIEVLVLLTIYAGVSIYYMFHFHVNTSLNGTDVSNCSEDDVKELWENEVKGYRLEIVSRDGSRETIAGSDFDLQLQWDDSVKKMLKKQNGFEWILKMRSLTELESSAIVSYDEKKLEKLVKKLNCFKKENQAEAVDATFKYVAGEGFALVNSIPGTKIDGVTFVDKLKEKICGLQPVYNIAEEGGYVEPRVKDDDEKLLSQIQKMNVYGKSSITYTIGDNEEVLDGSTFCDWFVKDEEGNVVISRDMVAEYVKDLGKKYNTCYTPKKLLTSYGKTVTISNSHYGWKIDNEAEIAQILKDLTTGQQIRREPVYLMIANSHGENDYGNSYIEINLTAQRLFLYKEGKCILESDFVSGNVSRGNGTPAGAFGVTYCEKNATLRGEDYETPVSFWMPFNGNIGMHDATWRGSFGGSIYKTRGSHGCVNLPYSSAKTIYENIKKNYPVLAYELPGTERLSQAEKEEQKKKEEEQKKKEEEEKKKKEEEKKKQEQKKNDKKNNKNSKNSKNN